MRFISEHVQGGSSGQHVTLTSLEGVVMVFTICLAAELPSITLTPIWWVPLMSLLFRYSPIPSYFFLFIIFLPLPILHHTPCQHNLPHNLCKPSWSPLTIPYTHHTIGSAPHCRFGIWPTDHTAWFSISSSFSVTWCALSWANWSQAIAPCGQGLITCFTANEPCAHFCLSFVFKPLVFTS